MKKLVLSFIVIVALAGTATQAGVIYTFRHIVEEGDGAAELANGAIGEAQMIVDVSNVGGDQALFTFINTGPEASSITDVYFDDGPLLGIVSIDDSLAGVEFSQGARPKNLPGGNLLSPPFETTKGSSADSDPPVQINGVNPGEYVGILFDLQDGNAFGDVIGSLDSGALRIGIRVQGFANCGSETFVNNGTIPAPGALLLGSIGTCFVGWMRRRRAL